MAGLEQLLGFRDQLNAAIDQVAASPAAKALPALSDASAPFPPLVVDDKNAPLASAIAKKMTALLAGPAHVSWIALSGHFPASLRVAIEAHISEAIAEGETEPGAGLEVDKIAQASCVDPTELGGLLPSLPPSLKLVLFARPARVLRLLAASCVFSEVRPSVFANNRCSIGLSTNKSLESLKQNPEDVYAGTDGRVALLAHCTEDCLKASSFLADALLDPEKSHSNASKDAPITRAFKIDGTVFDYWAKPENKAYLTRFSHAMYAINQSIQGDEALTTGYPFQSMAKDAVLVDVGGGVGSVVLNLLQHAPQLRFVVQDRPEVIEQQAPAMPKGPQALESGQVELQSHDFFRAQPVKGAALYLLRFVIHDWADDDAIAILKPPAKAASSASRLLLVEQSYRALEPDPLVVSPLPYLADTQMLVANNAQERTQEHHPTPTTLQLAMQPSPTPDFIELTFWSDEQRATFENRPLRLWHPRLRRLAVYGSARYLPAYFFQTLPASLEHIYLRMSIHSLTSETLRGLPPSVKTLTYVDSAHLQARLSCYSKLYTMSCNQNVCLYRHRSHDRRGPFWSSRSWNEWLAARGDLSAWRG